MPDVEFLAVPGGEESGAPEAPASGRRAPAWLRALALAALVGVAGGAVLLSGGDSRPASSPTPTPSPTVHLGEFHETDPSLHHQLFPGSGYLY